MIALLKHTDAGTLLDWIIASDVQGLRDEVELRQFGGSVKATRDVARELRKINDMPAIILRSGVLRPHCFLGNYTIIED